VLAESGIRTRDGVLANVPSASLLVVVVVVLVCVNGWLVLGTPARGPVSVRVPVGSNSELVSQLHATAW
jgi:hypothetical protein